MYSVKAGQAIKSLVNHYSFPEVKLLKLVTSDKLTPEELYRIMGSLDYLWSPTRHCWLGLSSYPSLDAARRAMATAGKEWQRARLEWLMVKCGMLKVEEAL
jgi:hypothetical protein